MSQEPGSRDTKVIAIGNQKGGVGKTTNAVQLARALAEMGRKCLIIDLDTNHSATSHLGIDGEAWLGTYEMLLGSESPEDVIVTNDSEEDIWLPENLDLIPAKRKLENVDASLLEKDKMVEPHRVLVEPIKDLRGDYDYIFLDTAPNITIPTIAAYKAAEWFLLSAMPDTFAVQGLDEAIKDINAARKHGNPNVRLLGVVLCSVDKRTRLTKSLLSYVHDTFKPSKGSRSRQFDTVISRSTVIPSAQKLGRTIFETEPNHKVTEQYRHLAREFKLRLEEFTRPQPRVPETAQTQPASVEVAQNG